MGNHRHNKDNPNARQVLTCYYYPDHPRAKEIEDWRERHSTEKITNAILEAILEQNDRETQSIEKTIDLAAEVAALREEVEELKKRPFTAPAASEIGGNKETEENREPDPDVGGFFED
ncbi:hypothetical protein EDC14_1004201 [Hydrogenispora ethanolica]|jgi:hypothetical protein|uniref:Uncharacterized protein n=1 Tax=Hydrogenispora ethanolica TaxID=1082276 RepID=A0A4R1S4P3_HYDET|nr:hypothetical protein [Hydrogenispora ethanolica]TCL74263.1 hypothetical protein EDC14_1004201 [Hydrogenispora ethanolica]